MLFYATKVLVSALIIVAITEIAKRNTGVAALLASLPLTSLLAFIWLHVEGATDMHIAELSQNIFWYVLPSLLFFILLPLLLKHGLGFWPSLGLTITVTVACYAAFTFFLSDAGTP